MTIVLSQTLYITYIYLYILIISILFELFNYNRGLLLFVLKLYAIFLNNVQRYNDQCYEYEEISI